MRKVFTRNFAEYLTKDFFELPIKSDEHLPLLIHVALSNFGVSYTLDSMRSDRPVISLER